MNEKEVKLETLFEKIEAMIEHIDEDHNGSSFCSWDVEVEIEDGSTKIIIDIDNDCGSSTSCVKEHVKFLKKSLGMDNDDEDHDF